MGFVRNTLGGITGSTAARAARRGAQIQSQAAEAALAEQRAAREQMVGQLSPFREAGAGALDDLAALAGQEISLQGLPSVLPSDIEQDTLFQSLKRQAISGIESSAAARGKLFSGTTPQAIAEQVQNLALGRAGDIQAMNLGARQQLLGERIGEQERRYQQLFNLAGMGQASAAQQAANIQGSASNVANLLGQQANALAAGRIGAANARSNLGQALLAAGVGIAGGNFSPSRPQAPSVSNYGPRDLA